MHEVGLVNKYSAYLTSKTAAIETSINISANNYVN